MIYSILIAFLTHLQHYQIFEFLCMIMHEAAKPFQVIHQTKVGSLFLHRVSRSLLPQHLFLLKIWQLQSRTWQEGIQNAKLQ